MDEMKEMKIDVLVKSLKRRISVIPAKAGINLFEYRGQFLITRIS